MTEKNYKDGCRQTAYLGHSSAQFQRMKVYFEPVVKFFDLRHDILQQVESHLEYRHGNIQ